MLDLIIKNAVILTMAGKGIGVIPSGAVGIVRNCIEVVDDSVFVMKNYRAERIIDAKGKIVLPGFVDAHCHTHSGMLCRGILTDLEFYLEQGMAGYMDTMDAEKELYSCKAHILEAVKRGTTTLGDMGVHYDVLSKVHEESGVRARICEQMRELPWDISEFLGGEYQFERKYAEDSIKAMFHLLSQYDTAPEERISVMVAFQALDYVTEELVVELREVAKKHKAMIHTHLAQSPFEMEEVERRYGARPVDTLERLGLLNSNTIAAHMVYNRKEENIKAAKNGLNMASCPCSWGEVGVSPPAAQFLHYGANVGLGCDEGSYTGINPIVDMKVGYINTNIDAYHSGVDTVSMSRILRMHTIGSAKVLGMDHLIGSLEPGKRADLIILDPNVINMKPLLLHPLTNIPQNIVSTATGNEVETVIIDGRIIMEDREMKTMDEKDIMEKVQTLGQQAAEDAAAYYRKLPQSEVLQRQAWMEKA